MSKKEAPEYYPESKKHWREWLKVNHVRQDAVWVIFYKKKTNKPSITWSDAFDEALCYAWMVLSYIAPSLKSPITLAWNYTV